MTFNSCTIQPAEESGKKFKLEFMGRELKSNEQNCGQVLELFVENCIKLVGDREIDCFIFGAFGAIK